MPNISGQFESIYEEIPAGLTCNVEEFDNISSSESEYSNFSNHNLHHSSSENVNTKISPYSLGKEATSKQVLRPTTLPKPSSRPSPFNNGRGNSEKMSDCSKVENKTLPLPNRKPGSEANKELLKSLQKKFEDKNSKIGLAENGMNQSSQQIESKFTAPSNGHFSVGKVSNDKLCENKTPYRPNKPKPALKFKDLESTSCSRDAKVRQNKISSKNDYLDGKGRAKSLTDLSLIDKRIVSSEGLDTDIEEDYVTVNNMEKQNIKTIQYGGDTNLNYVNGSVLSTAVNGHSQQNKNVCSIATDSQNENTRKLREQFRNQLDRCIKKVDEEKSNSVRSNKDINPADIPDDSACDLDIKQDTHDCKIDQPSALSVNPSQTSIKDNSSESSVFRKKKINGSSTWNEKIFKQLLKRDKHKFKSTENNSYDVTDDVTCDVNNDDGMNADEANRRSYNLERKSKPSEQRKSVVSERFTGSIGRLLDKANKKRSSLVDLFHLSLTSENSSTDKSDNTTTSTTPATSADLAAHLAAHKQAKRSESFADEEAWSDSEFDAVADDVYANFNQFIDEGFSKESDEIHVSPSTSSLESGFHSAPSAECNDIKIKESKTEQIKENKTEKIADNKAEKMAENITENKANGTEKKLTNSHVTDVDSINSFTDENSLEPSGQNKVVKPPFVAKPVLGVKPVLKNPEFVAPLVNGESRAQKLIKEKPHVQPKSVVIVNKEEILHSSKEISESPSVTTNKDDLLKAKQVQDKLSFENLRLNERIHNDYVRQNPSTNHHQAPQTTVETPSTPISPATEELNSPDSDYEEIDGFRIPEDVSDESFDEILPESSPEESSEPVPINKKMKELPKPPKPKPAVKEKPNRLPLAASTTPLNHSFNSINNVESPDSGPERKITKPLPPKPPAKHLKPTNTISQVAAEPISAVKEALIGNDRDRYLDVQPWYFGDIPKEICEQSVLQVAQVAYVEKNWCMKLCLQIKNGAFVVRRSHRSGGSTHYAVAVLYDSLVYNLMIRHRSDAKYAIGSEKPDEPIFDSVTDLISFHRNNPIKLADKTYSGSVVKTRLTVSPSK